LEQIIIRHVSKESPIDWRCAMTHEDQSAQRKSSLACGCLEPLNSLNLNQDDQVGEELAKTVIHDDNFIHVLIAAACCTL
jgi:hypothetical protein